MDPDKYFFICKTCGRAFETASDATNPDVHEDGDMHADQYDLVDGSVVDQNHRFIPLG